ncbi:MAG: hypothetical protein IIY02_00055 [Firmicutes bacterium]|nr:hypothetical protein [Bacillota bacterium]
MFIITLRQLRSRLLTVLIAILVLIALCQGLPAAYDFLAAEAEEEEFEKLDDPVRVKGEEDTAFTAEWLSVFGQ